MWLSFVIDESTDVYQWFVAYGSIVATKEVFNESKDILTTIKNNDNAKEKYVSRAANDILLVVNDEYDKFLVEQIKDLALETAENLALLGVSFVSTINQFVLVINLAVDFIGLLTPLSKIADAVYGLYSIDQIVNACKMLFSDSGSTDLYYNIINTRHIKLLSYARTWGGEVAKQLASYQLFVG